MVGANGHGERNAPAVDNECPACGGGITQSYRFCPHCGRLLGGKSATEERTEKGLCGDLQRQRLEERRVRELWRGALWLHFLVGAFLLTLPDTVLLVLFGPWLPAPVPWMRIATFLLVDAAVGMLTVLLLEVAAARGSMGELILIGLRGGQFLILNALGLLPFSSLVLAGVLFLGVPCLTLLLMPLLFRLHLTGLLDNLALLYRRRFDPATIAPAGAALSASREAE